MDYEQFLERKTQLGGEHGFEPIWMPPQLFDFQRALVEWSVRKGPFCGGMLEMSHRQRKG